PVEPVPALVASPVRSSPVVAMSPDAIINTGPPSMDVLDPVGVDARVSMAPTEILPPAAAPANPAIKMTAPPFAVDDVVVDAPVEIALRLLAFVPAKTRMLEPVVLIFPTDTAPAWYAPPRNVPAMIMPRAVSMAIGLAVLGVAVTMSTAPLPLVLLAVAVML